MIRHSRSRRRSAVLRLIYALCLSGAAANHAHTIWRHGWSWHYGGVPAASALFWTSLAVIDPAAVLLLWLHPRAGIAATVAIIIVDVAHNVWIVARYWPPLLNRIGDTPQLAAQIAFLFAVLASAPTAWRGAYGK